MRLRVRDFMESDEGWGREQGHQLYVRLLKVVEQHPDELIIRLSLEGISRTDASFPREGVMALARRYRGTKGFCLVDAVDEDLLDNWDAAALRLQQPMFAWNASSYRLLGPVPSQGTQDVLNFILHKGVATSVEVANVLGLKVANSSNKLKELWQLGYIMRRSEVAPSGGVEYLYYRIS